jgi:hypothetical protein
VVADALAQTDGAARAADELIACEAEAARARGIG